jgi:hypothetical protein
MAHGYEGYQCDKYYTPPASETQGEEEEESTPFGNGVLPQYSSEEDDGVSKSLHKYYPKVETDKSPSACYFDQFTPEILDNYSSADSKGKTEKPPRSGRSKVEVIAARGAEPSLLL